MTSNEITVYDMLEQARKWPRDGFGEGRWFHAMADEIERLRAELTAISNDYSSVAEAMQLRARRALSCDSSAPETSARLMHCPYCRRPADSEGCINHVVNCAGLETIELNRLQHDALTKAKSERDALRNQLLEHAEVCGESAYPISMRSAEETSAPLTGGTPIGEYIAELDKDPDIKSRLDRVRAAPKCAIAKTCLEYPRCPCGSSATLSTGE